MVKDHKYIINNKGARRMGKPKNTVNCRVFVGSAVTAAAAGGVGVVVVVVVVVAHPQGL
jgi:hypothetical protein